MYRVVQIHHTYKKSMSGRYWNYKTEAGAKRRVWLCKHSPDNIRVYYFEFEKLEVKND